LLTLRPTTKLVDHPLPAVRECLFNMLAASALGPTQPPIKWVPGALSLGV